MAYSTLSLLLALVMQLAEGGIDTSPSAAPSVSSDGSWMIDDHDRTVLYALYEDEEAIYGTCYMVIVGVLIYSSPPCLLNATSCISGCNEDEFVPTEILGTYQSTDDWGVSQTFVSDLSCTESSKVSYWLSVYESSDQTGISINLSEGDCMTGIFLVVPAGTSGMVAPAASTTMVEGIDKVLAGAKKADANVKTKSADSLSKAQQEGADVLKWVKRKFEAEKSHAAAISKKANEKDEQAKDAAEVPPPARRLVFV